MDVKRLMNNGILAGILSLFIACTMPVSAMAACAVAFDKAVNKIGYCSSKPTVKEAVQCAIAECRESGGQNCTVNVSSAQCNGYSAIAMGGGAIGVGLGDGARRVATDPIDEDDKVLAFERALQECSRCDDGDENYDTCIAGTSCRIMATWVEPAKPASAGKPLPRTAPSGNSTMIGQTTAVAAKMNVKGAALLKEKRYSEAVDAYNRALEANPYSDYALSGRANAYVKMGPDKYGAALSDLGKAIGIHPKNSRYYLYQRAMLYKKLGREKDCLQDLKRAANRGNKRAKALLDGQKAQNSRPSGSSVQSAADGGQVGSGNPAKPLSNGMLVPVSTASASALPDKNNSSAKGGAGTFVGTWYGTTKFTAGNTLVVKADGTYDYNGSPGGHWKAGGNQIVFHGNLAAWDGGKATLDGGGNLAFSWRASNGFHQWFTFARAGGGSGGGGGAALAGNDGKSAYSAPAGVLMGGSIQGNALTLQGTFTHFATLPSTYKGFLEGAAGITTDGTNLYVVAGPHGIWGAPGVVYKVSISTGAVTELASIPAPGNITTDGTNVYVQVGGGSIDEISISTGAVSALSTDSHYSSGPMTTNGKYLYVRNGSLPSDKIDMLSTSNGRVSGSSYNTSAMMPDYITTDGQRLLILGHNFSNRIALFKMRFGTHMVAQSDLIIDNISEGPMTCDGKNLFIVSGSGITKVSISTGAASTLSWSGHYATDSFPGITTDGKSLFVVDHTANTILRIQ